MKKVLLSLAAMASLSAFATPKQVTIECGINQQILQSQFSGTVVLTVNDDNTVTGNLTYSTFVPGQSGVVAGSPAKMSGSMSVIPAGQMYINPVDSYQLVNDSEPASVSLAITTDTKENFSSRLLLNGEDEYYSLCDYK